MIKSSPQKIIAQGSAEGVSLLMDVFEAVRTMLAVRRAVAHRERYGRTFE